MPQSVLILRPEPGNSVTASKVRALGLTAIQIPLFEAQSLDWTCTDPDIFDGVLMTSANAPRLAGSHVATLTHLKAYAVGPATADAAKNAGFTRIETGPSNAEALLAQIASSGGRHHLLHLGRGDTFPINYENITVSHSKTYKIIPSKVNFEWLGSNPLPLIVMLHSPQAAARFATLTGISHLDRAQIMLLAISEATARKAGSGWHGVAIAPEPRDEAMLSSLLLLAGLKEKLDE